MKYQCKFPSFLQSTYNHAFANFTFFQVLVCDADIQPNTAPDGPVSTVSTDLQASLFF